MIIVTRSYTLYNINIKSNVLKMLTRFTLIYFSSSNDIELQFCIVLYIRNMSVVFIVQNNGKFFITNNSK